jgi:hypothetical protein
MLTLIRINNDNIFKKISYNHFFQFSKSSSSSISSPSIVDDYHQVPQYNCKSALYIRPSLKSDQQESVFTRIISPDLDMNSLLNVKNVLKSPLSANLSARHLNLNLSQLKDDYLKFKNLNDKIEKLNLEKHEISEKMKELVKLKGGIKFKKETMESEEAKKLLNEGNEIKNEINKIMEELIPTEEFISIACLRLPNDLHSSAMFIYFSQINKDLEFDNNDYTNELVLFNLNKQTSRFNQLSSNDWKLILKSSGSEKNVLGDKWSFVDKPICESGLNNQYLVGSYAKLEQATVDYIYDRINKLNNHSSNSFENFKSVSMFKSAVVEGCGENFNDPNQNLNIVRFSRSGNLFNTELHHLTGSASLNGLVLNFVRTQISKKYLPWTVFTNGKSYSPKNGQVNSFDLLTLCQDKSKLVVDNQQNIDNMKHFISEGQSYLNKLSQELDKFSSVDQFPLDELIFSTKNNNNIDQLFIDHIKMFVYVLKDFNQIPIRFVCSNPSELKNSESFRIEVQAYLPSERNYVTVLNFFI